MARAAGRFSSVHGYCSCPVLFEDKVIVNGDHDGDSYLVALDKADGQALWKTDRENKTRSYSTPIIRQIDGRTQMILSGSKCVASYDPHDGSAALDHRRADRAVRGLDGLQRQAAVHDRRLSRTAHAGDPARRPRQRDRHATSPGGRPKQASYVPSPIAVGDYFLVVSDGGIASCFESESGERLWMERIGTHYSASLVTAGGLVYFLADDGMTTVVRPGAKLDVVAENELGEYCYASPAISQGQIFLRGAKHLFASGRTYGAPMRRRLGWPITLGVVMILLVVALIIGWIMLTVAATVGGCVLALGTVFLSLVLVGVVLYLLDFDQGNPPQPAAIQLHR